LAEEYGKEFFVNSGVVAVTGRIISAVLLLWAAVVVVAMIAAETLHYYFPIPRIHGFSFWAIACGIIGSGVMITVFCRKKS
jgi:hypothetical protein